MLCCDKWSRFNCHFGHIHSTQWNQTRYLCDQGAQKHDDRNNTKLHSKIYRTCQYPGQLFTWNVFILQYNLVLNRINCAFFRRKFRKCSQIHLLWTCIFWHKERLCLRQLLKAQQKPLTYNFCLLNHCPPCCLTDSLLFLHGRQSLVC